jgi:cytochrome c551/c552
MLPAIQENILLLKSFQVATQILLCLLLGYLMGEAFFRLPEALHSRHVPHPKSPVRPNGQRPKLLSGWRTGLFLVLGLSFNLLALKIAYRITLLQGLFWGALMVAFILGICLLLLARQYSIRQDFITGLFFLLGVEGEVLLFGVAFLLLNAESLLLRPELWPFVDARPILFGSWHGLVRFAEFLLLALLLATAGRLRHGSHGDQRAHPATLVAVLLLPFCLLLELAMTPQLARTPAFFILAGLFVATTAAIALLLAASCFGSRLKVANPLLGTTCLLVALWVLGSFTARERVLTPVTLAGLTGLGEGAPAEDLESLFAPDGETVATAPAAKSGESLFNQKCTVCHRFDQRLVGPPLDSVLPKYRDAKSKLQAYLGDPVKIDPDYPAMPDLGLTDQETAALADFLLSRDNAQKPKQTPDNT